MPRTKRKELEDLLEGVNLALDLSGEDTLELDRSAQGYRVIKRSGQLVSFRMPAGKMALYLEGMADYINLEASLNNR